MPLTSSWWTPLAPFWIPRVLDGRTLSREPPSPASLALAIFEHEVAYRRQKAWQCGRCDVRQAFAKLKGCHVQSNKKGIRRVFIQAVTNAEQDAWRHVMSKAGGRSARCQLAYAYFAGACPHGGVDKDNQVDCSEQFGELRDQLVAGDDLGMFTFRVRQHLRGNLAHGVVTAQRVAITDDERPFAHGEAIPWLWHTVQVVWGRIAHA